MLSVSGLFEDAVFIFAPCMHLHISNYFRLRLHLFIRSIEGLCTVCVSTYLSPHSWKVKKRRKQIGNDVKISVAEVSPAPARQRTHSGLPTVAPDGRTTHAMLAGAKRNTASPSSDRQIPHY